MKKYIFPLLLIILGGWLLKLENIFIKGSALSFVVTITSSILMFAFGILLQHKRKNRTWVKKLVVSFIYLLLVVWDLGFLNSINYIETIFSFLCLNNDILLNLVYILLGWLFFD